MKIKICCISSVAEAELAIGAGTDVLGLVGHMPSGPGTITDELAAAIVAYVPSQVETFLLTSETSVQGITAQQNRVNSSALQMVDEIDTGDYQLIRLSLPGVKLIQVIHVLDQTSVDQAIQISGDVDALLLDSGNPSLTIKELGGTGRTHDWKLSQKIVASVDVPVYLAGGINQSNVQNAINQVNPYGLDLCRSVRTDGHLDASKLSGFMANAVER